MLNLIAGFESPTRGEITHHGKPITSPSPQRGVVFQEYSLMPWMNVLDNVIYGLESTDLSSRKKTIIARECLKKVGLSDFEDQRPNLLSGGMKQRVAIARVLAMDPDIMLMDEPFSSLDEHTRKRLDQEVVEIWKEKQKTVVFVTHNVDEALSIGTRIVMFSSSPGTIVKEWNIPPKTCRDLSTEKMLSVKKQILDFLQSHATENV
jgi:ABC-type nitrate/sulfonate/bicarbonate transport system ATPase subunit